MGQSGAQWSQRSHDLRPFGRLIIDEKDGVSEFNHQGGSFKARTV